MIVRTAKEAKSDHIEKMGEPLGTQFAALWQEVVYLHTKWGEYVEMFGSGPSRVKLLNSAAPAFFRMIQDVLWEDTLLHIARLTDASKSLGRDDKANLTIKNLPELVSDPSTRAALQALVDKALSNTKFCRDLRNRHLAHRALDLATDTSADPLEGASRAEVNDALRAIADVLNFVQLHFEESETHYKADLYSNGAKSLLYVLDDGVKAEEKRRQRLLRGQPTDEDGHRDL